LRVCVPVCEATVAAARDAIIRAREAADIVELRLDCLTAEDFDRFKELSPFLTSFNVPIIVTLRPREQGGYRDVDQESRLRFWRSLSDSDQVFHDVELDLLEGSQQWQSQSADHLICSHHDLTGTPANLESIYERMAATPAQILKLAVHAQDATDCIPIFNVLARAQSDKREMIAIAMGPAGLATRILGPSRGSFLTYATLDHERQTAPGQPTVSELKTLYRIDQIDRETQITGLIGWPLTHSVSPHMHNAALEAAHVNGVYLPFPVRDVDAFLKRMVHPQKREIDWNIRGLSVTAPHKSAVIKSLDWIDSTAAELGAVNTVVVESDELHGYNTDAVAFTQFISSEFGELVNARCAVIGSGGAARAVLWSLDQAGSKVSLFARNEAQAQVLAEEFGVDTRSLADPRFNDFDLVVNATPLGTKGALEEQTPATAEQLSGARMACDLVYNPQETRFLREARATGCQTLGGLQMLVNQATEQFRLWSGIRAPQNVMMRVAREALAKG
jgi:3-dehydroquinate dehydratase/shikimate dehydrogenase